MNANNELLKSGRKIYRHENNQGSVLEFNMFGREVKLFVADAKYRTTAKWSSIACDFKMSKYGYSDEAYPYNVSGSDDNQLQSQFSEFAQCETESAKQNTDNLMKFPFTCAAHACRNVNIDGLGSLDLPNIYELAVIFLEADAIDNLDPTVDTYPEFALGSKNPAGAFDFDGECCAWSSCVYHDAFSRTVNYNGKAGHNNVSYTAGVCPVKEL